MLGDEDEIMVAVYPTSQASPRRVALLLLVLVLVPNNHHIRHQMYVANLMYCFPWTGRVCLVCVSPFFLLLQNAVASLPSTCSSSSSNVGEASIPPAAAASVASVAASRDHSSIPPAAALGTVDEYPRTVQELVMNGFDLPRVVRAFELIGDNFDDLLSFLMSNTTTTTS